MTRAPPRTATTHLCTLFLALLALAACARHAPPAPVMAGHSAPSQAMASPAAPPPAIVPSAPPPRLTEQPEVAAPFARATPRASVTAEPLEAPPRPPPSTVSDTGSSMPRPPAPHPDRVAVRPGETLYALARRYDVPVRVLIEANGLTAPYSLTPGRSLVLPRLRQHQVQPGETLYAVSRLLGVDIATLARANDLAPPYPIHVGDTLILPAVPALPAAEEPEPAAGPPPREVVAALPPPAAPAHRGHSFLWPVRGRVIARYGTGDGGTHSDGINIAAPSGTMVVAADAGTVAYAGNELRGYGNLVLIKHPGGWMTAYAHNAKLLVKRGDKVRRGQAIARVGHTGAVSAPQLHFEIRRGAKALDPGDYLPAAPATVHG